MSENYHKMMEATMQNLVYMISKIVPGHGIALLVWPEGAPPGKRVNFASNRPGDETRDVVYEMLPGFVIPPVPSEAAPAPAPTTEPAPDFVSSPLNLQDHIHLDD